MSKDINSDNNVAKYYSRFCSWAGYNLVMGRSQHFGYWTKSTKNEKTAQKNYLNKLTEILKLKKGEVVLDAGSGQGYVARHLAKTTDAKVIGITITPREVKVSGKLSKHMINAPEFVFGDYSKTDFPDEYFDVVYTNESLCHAMNIRGAIKEFYRIMKPDGRLVLFDYEIDTTKLSKDNKKTVDFLVKYAGGNGLYQQNPGQISRAMKSAGFTKISETDWSKYTKPGFDRLRNIAKILAWIKPTSKLAPYFVNTIMANHGYSKFYEDGIARYVVYQGVKK